MVTARFGAFVVDTDRRQLLRGDVAVHLTPLAFDFLALLIARAPAVVTKAEIHQHLWPDTFVSDASVIGLVKEVRRALEDDRDAPLIRTAHRVGYAFTGTRDSRPSGVALAAGPSWIVAGTRRIALQPGVNVIGRDPDAAVWLDVPGISRRHAQITLAGADATLEDLGSKNGTLVGDRPVRGRVELKNADRIQIVTETLVFYTSSTSMSTATQPVAGGRSKTDRK